MAESTYWMNWAAWAGVVFTGVAAFLIWRTLIATQDTVAETRRIGEAQVRAYIGLHNPRFKFEWVANDDGVERLTPHFICDFHNSGTTPAYYARLSIMVGYAFSDRPTSAVDEYFGPRGDLLPISNRAGYEVVADDTVTYKMGSVPAALTDEEYRRVMNRATTVFLAVRTFYSDVFGQPVESHIRRYEATFDEPPMFGPIPLDASGLDPTEVAEAIQRGAFRSARHDRQE